LLQACVAAVGTGVAVGASTAVDRRTTGTIIEDQSIELKTTQAFRANEQISNQAHWNVISYNTKVLLTGEATSEEVRRQMVEIARNIAKVTQVYNEITIAAPSSMMSRSSDTVITTKVKSRLLADSETKGMNIKVATEKGVVYLMGLVSRQQAELATEITRQTGGVQKVVTLFEYTD
jgi:osmotically-inducible protein OsmY